MSFGESGLNTSLSTRRSGQAPAPVLVGAFFTGGTRDAGGSLSVLRIVAAAGAYVLRRIYGGWLRYLCNGTQHAGLQDDVPDFRLCTRTVLLNPLHAFSIGI